MSAPCEVVARRASAGSLGGFERYLTVWVFLGIAVGILLGWLWPSGFGAIGAVAVAQVNLPVAVLIWLMIVPMLLKIDFGAIGGGGDAEARRSSPACSSACIPCQSVRCSQRWCCSSAFRARRS